VGVDRQSKARIHIGTSALCWSIWRCRNDIVFNKNFFSLFAGYPYDGALGTTLGLSSTPGATGCHGYWMHTAADGRSGYLVSGWLATY
jgi:hypothetical protein